MLFTQTLVAYAILHSKNFIYFQKDLLFIFYEEFVLIVEKLLQFEHSFEI